MRTQSQTHALRMTDLPPQATAAPPLPLRSAAAVSATAAGASGVVSEAREALVANAVEFLRHPNVVGTPLARRVAFLKRKGLTSSEIDAALRQASAPAAAAVAATAAAVSDATARPQAQEQSFWSSWKGGLCVGLIAAGAICGAVYAYKEYVRPWLDKKREKENAAAAEGSEQQ